jgi:tRNA 2-selenouridine synthase
MRTIQQIDIAAYSQRTEHVCLLDARSEAEFLQGHIPGAVSFPLLNNQERIIVGTCYKTKGSFEAVVLGYELVAPKFAKMIKNAHMAFGKNKLIVHCWRGGLRSQILGNLLLSAGFDVTIIEGGYKAYRQFVQKGFEVPYPIKVIGGYTGSGKTDILYSLRLNGEQVIDLEGLANHRGSAFGGIGKGLQPSQEQFENNLFSLLHLQNREKCIWVEDESRLIGKIQIPDLFFQQIRKAPLYFIEKDLASRINTIIENYAKYNKDELIQATKQISKKLGDLRTRIAVEALQNSNYNAWVNEVLYYYDKAYNNGLQSKVNSSKVHISGDKQAIISQLMVP